MAACLELLYSKPGNARFLCTGVVNNTDVLTWDIAKPAHFVLNRLMTDSFGTSTWLKISSALMWVLFLAIACVLWELFFTFGWNVYLRPHWRFLKNLFGRQVRIRPVPLAAEQLVLPSSHSHPSSSLLVHLWSLLMLTENFITIKQCRMTWCRMHLCWFMTVNLMYLSVKQTIPGQSWVFGKEGRARK